MLAGALAFAALVLMEWGSARIPAYHDGRLHFDVAWAFRERLGFPFVATLDTGHPPLVSYLLALAWLLPVPRLLMMHLFAWATASVFVAAVFDVGRRALGVGAGAFAAGLLFLHPVFAAQALQLNLDLFHAAFAWVAILAVVSGRPRLLSLSASAAALAKLNGLFTCAGIAVWVTAELIRSRDLRPRRVLAALAPLGVAVAVTVVYHLAKLALVGHLFATEEFRDDNLTFVHGFAEYGQRVSHAVDQIVGFNNPNLWVVRALGAAFGACLVGLATGKLALTALSASPPVPNDDARFYRALSPAAALSVVATVAAVHVALWSLRSYPALVRYFLLVYPALYLLLGGALVLVSSRTHAVGLALFGPPLAALFAVQARPTDVARLFPRHADALLFPPSHIDTNYENSLELVDLMTVLGRTAARVDRTVPPVLRIAAKWPFEAYFTDPRHGVVRTARDFSPDDPDLVIDVATFHPGMSARDVLPRPGFARGPVERVGRVWMAVYVREDRNGAEP